MAPKAAFAFRAVILLSLLCTLPAPAVADEVFTFVFEKQEQKSHYDWWLQDWLETQNKIRIMDLWLSLHSPSPYEFFVDGEYRAPTNGSTLPFNHGQLSAGAYATLVGLEADQTLGAAQSETRVLAGLRVFGFSQQGTHLNLLGGLVNRAGQPESTRSATVGTRLNLHIFRYAGLDASFYHDFPATPVPTGSTNQYSLGAFIDFSALRVYGEYFSSSDPSSPTGFGTGIRLFF